MCVFEWCPTPMAYVVTGRTILQRAATTPLQPYRRSRVPSYPCSLAAVRPAAAIRPVPSGLLQSHLTWEHEAAASTLLRPPCRTACTSSTTSDSNVTAPQPPTPAKGAVRKPQVDPGPAARHSSPGKPRRPHAQGTDSGKVGRGYPRPGRSQAAHPGSFERPLADPGSFQPAASRPHDQRGANAVRSQSQLPSALSVSSSNIPPSRPSSSQKHGQSRPRARHGRVAATGGSREPHRSMPTYPELEAHIRGMGVGTPTKDIRHAMHKLVKLHERVRHPDGPLSPQYRALMDILASLLQPRVSTITDTATLFNLIWCCGKAAYWELLLTQLMKRVMANKAALLKRGNGQGMATVLRLLVTAAAEASQELPMPAVKRLLQQQESVLEAVHSRWQHMPLADVSPQSLSNSMHACGKLHEHSPAGSGHTLSQLLTTLSSVACKMGAKELQTFEAQHLSNVLYALAIVGARDQQELINLLAAECCRRGPGAFDTPQDLSNSTWALAKLGYRETPYYSLVVQAMTLEPVMRGAVAQEWANAVSALAQVLHYNADLLRHISYQILEEEAMQWATPQNTANVLMAYATFGHRDIALQSHLLQQCSQHLGQANAQELSNTLWSVAASGTLVQHTQRVAEVVNEVNTRGVSDFALESLRQLWQVHSELKAAGLHTPCISPEIIMAAKDAVRARLTELSKEQSKSSSDVSVRVLHALAALQLYGAHGILAVSPKAVVEELLMHVDVLVEFDSGRKVVVEVDGPMRYMTNEPSRKDGRTRRSVIAG